MKKIYLAAYKEFKDYNGLKEILDYFLSKTDKKDVIFYVTSGEKGDSTCMKYVVNNGYKYIDWCKNKFGNRAEQKLPFIQNCDHSVLVTDGKSKGIGVALLYSTRHVKGKIVVIKPLEKVFAVWENGKLICEKEYGKV